jgi:hypothetical protein
VAKLSRKKLSLPLLSLYLVFTVFREATSEPSRVESGRGLDSSVEGGIIIVWTIGRKRSTE